MFALKFDDKKRKLIRDQNITLNKLVTCYANTPEYEAWMSLFLRPDNTTVDIITEDDPKVVTFFTWSHPKKEVAA